MPTEASDLIHPLIAVLQSVAGDASEQMLQDAQELISEGYPPASEPGSPPHRRSGDLYESLTGGIVVDGEGNVEVYLTSSVYYAEYLEEGTENMDARPFMSVIQERWEDKLYDLLEQHMGSF